MRLSNKDWLFYFLITFLLSLRFFHFEETIDSPHTWRQSDTANYIWDFYINGVDLFHPSVCWLGNHKTLVLECPVPEVIISQLYHVFGPSHIVARSFFFLSFIFSVIYFYKIIKLLYSDRLAQWSTILFISTPLSLFFSRAIQIDFFTIALVHAFTFFALKGLKEKSFKTLLIASILATMGMPIKSPYFLPVILPIAIYAYQKEALRFGLRNIYLLLLPLFSFILWQRHAYQVNAAAPEWHYILGYRKFTDNNSWYYGPWSQRFVFELWELIYHRLRFEVLGFIGLTSMLIGSVCISKLKNATFTYLWLLGSIIYLLVFFNLNTVHNYYQIPFIAPLTILIAQGLIFIGQLTYKKNYLAYTLLILLVWNNHEYARKNYYKVQEDQMTLGKVIASQTEATDLSIVSFFEIDSKCPNFLYAARRNGWTIPRRGLTPEVISKLQKQGAKWLYYVNPSPLPREVIKYLAPYKNQVYELKPSLYIHTFELQ